MPGLLGSGYRQGSRLRDVNDVAGVFVAVDFHAVFLRVFGETGLPGLAHVQFQPWQELLALDLDVGGSTRGHHCDGAGFSDEQQIAVVFVLEDLGAEFGCLGREIGFARLADLQIHAV